MNTNLNMQTMPIDRLKPAKYNPRKDLKPGDPAYEKIKRSLYDFGYVDGCQQSDLQLPGIGCPGGRNCSWAGG